MNFLSDLGGIFNAILFLSSVIIHVFHENMVYGRILSSLFTIQAVSVVRNIDFTNPNKIKASKDEIIKDATKEIKSRKPFIFSPWDIIKRSI